MPIKHAVTGVGSGHRHRPEIRGTDHAIWRRIRLVPFNTTIPLDEQDRELPEKLMEEAPAILSWLVRGALIWQEEGLGNSPEVDEATAEFRAEQDGIGEFIGSKVEFESGSVTNSADLYAAYKAWCEESNEKTLTRRQFSYRVGERGVSKSRGHANKVMWHGIRVT